MLSITYDDAGRAYILVIGIGNGGNRAVDAMFSDVDGIDFIAVNTDSFALEKNYPETKIQIGEKTVNGLGTNGNMETGRKSAEESLKFIEKVIEKYDYDMVFIVAGMGGGTGGGAAPVIASAIKKKGILTIGVVTKPFLFEGTKCMQNAENGINKLKENVDTLIVIPNQKLIESENKDIGSLKSFRRAHRTLKQCIMGIIYPINYVGMIGIDFWDVRCLMSEKGRLANIGIGYCCGDEKNRAEIVTEAVCKSPLIEIPIEEAKNIMITVFGTESLGLLETGTIAESIKNRIDPDAEVIFSQPSGNFLDKLGVSFDEGIFVIIILKYISQEE